jgi:murein DD-endopeptidase MepM/ murein hydrolase activator NlpD
VAAWAGRHIYGRHAYGSGDLVNPNGSVVIGNPSRPFEELGHLRAAGAAGGIVITECGLDAGFGFAGEQRFVQQITGYEKLLRPYPEFIGLAAWTLGNWSEANWQDAIPALTAYLEANPSPKWEWPGQPEPPDPPANPGTLQQRLWAASVAEQIARGIPLNPAAGLQNAIRAAGQTPVHREISAEGVVIQAGESVTGTPPRRVYVYEPGKPIWSFSDPSVAPVDPPPAEFTLSKPVLGIPYYVTDWFNTPRDYEGNHEGIDLRATNSAGQPAAIVAAAAGVVDGIRATDPGTGYGIYVRLRHERPGVVWKTWYCHLSRVATGLQVGQAVVAGQVLGTAGSTGNSTGIHLHLTVQKLPGGLPGFVIDSVVDPAPLLGLTPPNAKLDLLPYIRGDGRIYTLRHSNGAQEDLQVQSADDAWVMVKNRPFESFHLHNDYIWRGIDTSPGPAPDYAERPGVDRYYKVNEPGQSGARWCKRYMAIGETFTGPGHHVQFFYKDNCQPSAANSGNATNRVTLVAHHASKTWGGFTVQDVVELTTNTGEAMFFAKSFGLVAWSSEWGNSHIIEVSPPGRPPLEREVMGCL